MTRRMLLGTTIVVVAALVVLGGGLVTWAVVTGPTGPLGLCDQEKAFREWKTVASTKPSTPERAKVARPIATALVKCDRPLIGLTRQEARERLGAPQLLPEADPDFWYYDLGGNPMTLEIGDGLVLEFAAGRVRNALIRG